MQVEIRLKISIASNEINSLLGYLDQKVYVVIDRFLSECIYMDSRYLDHIVPVARPLGITRYYFS